MLTLRSCPPINAKCLAALFRDQFQGPVYFNEQIKFVTEERARLELYGERLDRLRAHRTSIRNALEHGKIAGRAYEEMVCAVRDARLQHFDAKSRVLEHMILWWDGSFPPPGFERFYFLLIQCSHWLDSETATVAYAEGPRFNLQRRRLAVVSWASTSQHGKERSCQP